MKSAFRLVVFICLCIPLLGQEIRFFPQIGDGAAGTLAIRTGLVLTNTGFDTQATLDFFKEDGTPLQIELPPLGKAASFTIPIGPGRTVFMETPGTGALQVGYARLTAPAQVGGTAVFTGIDTPTHTILFEAGVPATQPLQNFTVVLDSLQTRNTGLAVVCPPATTQATGSLTIVLYDDQFNRIASRDVPIAKGQKIAKYIEEFFAGDDAAVSAAREMRGSVSVMSDLPVAAVTLRQMASQPFPVGVPTLTTFPVVNDTAYPVAGEWKLAWSDEFEGPSIDLNKWGYEIGGNGWGNSEREYYTDSPQNSFIENGKLVIEAKTDLTRQYTSARMRTREKGDWKFGRIEVRAKLPKGKGIWPAIWMMPTDSVYGTWPASGEIDIMELLGHEPNKVYGTIHFRNEAGGWSHPGLFYVLPTGNFADDFHVFAIEWEPTEMRWYVDGIQYTSQTDWKSSVAPLPAPFDKRFYLILNVAVGGNWPGYPDATTQFPQRMEVEYVRVYQRR